MGNWCCFADEAFFLLFDEDGVVLELLGLDDNEKLLDTLVTKDVFPEWVAEWAPGWAPG